MLKSYCYVIYQVVSLYKSLKKKKKHYPSNEKNSRNKKDEELQSLHWKTNQNDTS